MCCATAKIQQADSLTLRSDYFEHDAVPLVNVVRPGPVHTEMRVAVPVETSLVMRNDAEILLFHHSSKLAFAIRWKVVSRRNVSCSHCLFVFCFVEDSAAKVFGARAGGPAALETSQTIIRPRKTGSRSEVEPLHSLTRE